MVIHENPPGYAAQWDSHDGEVRSLVRLPDNFEEVPLGASEQHEKPWESGW
jgi:hypothetical protein